MPRYRSREQTLRDLYTLLGRMQSHSAPNHFVIHAIQKEIKRVEALSPSSKQAR